MKRVDRHLSIRNGVYQYRRAIAERDRPAFGGKTAIVRSLKTGDIREARTRLLEYERQFERTLRASRGEWAPSPLSPHAASERLRQPTDEEVQRHIRVWLKDYRTRFFRETMVGVKSRRADDGPEAAREELTGALSMLERAYEREELPLHARWLVEQMIEEGGYDAPEGSPAYNLIGRYVVDGLFEAYRQELAAINRSPERVHNRDVFGADRYKDDEAAPKSVPTLREIAEAWLSDPIRSDNAKTKVLYRGRTEVILEALGETTPVTSVDREQCRRALNEVIRVYPAHLSSEAIRLPLQARIKAGQREGRSPISAATQNLYIDVMRGLFEWSVREGFRDSNPAQGLRVRKPRSRARLPFSPTALQTLFDAPLYTGCVDDEEGYARPGTARPRRHRFWIPLIGLYSGMRLNEICQLSADDVAKEQGIWTFRLWADADEGRTLKTLGSARIVPVHPQLLELGFEDYVAARQRKGKRLFPELTGNPDGYGSDPFSKWFSRFLKNAGVKDDTLCFHSFRHNFRDAVRESGAPVDVQHALGGWTEGSVSERYGVGHSTKTLHKAIARVSYEGLNLDRLKAVSAPDGLQPVATDTVP